MSKNILITGGAGFLGSHLCEKLLNEGNNIVCVDNLIDGMVKAMESDEAGPINIGNPDEYTILELAEIVIDITGSVSKITHHNLHKDDPTKRKSNISKAKKYLSWSPNIGLNEGLTKTVSYFNNQ